MNIYYVFWTGIDKGVHRDTTEASPPPWESYEILSYLGPEKDNIQSDDRPGRLSSNTIRRTGDPINLVLSCLCFSNLYCLYSYTIIHRSYTVLRVVVYYSYHRTLLIILQRYYLQKGCAIRALHGYTKRSYKKAVLKSELTCIHLLLHPQIFQSPPPAM